VRERWVRTTKVPAARAVSDFFLQFSQYTSSIEVVWSLNKNYRPDIIMETIYEMKEIVTWICGRSVSRQLIYELCETLNIFSNCACLFDVKQLANQRFLLIATETIMDKITENIPLHGGNLALHGLQPPGCCVIKVHARDRDPNRTIHTIHVKVSLRSGLPELGVFTRELGERNFG